MSRDNVPQSECCIYDVCSGRNLILNILHTSDADLHCVAMAALLEVLACSTPDVALSFKSKLQWIKVMA